MAKRGLIGVVYNSYAPEAHEVAVRLIRTLGIGKRSWTATAHDVGLAAPQMRETHTVITVGGDGTILRAARVAAPEDVPLVSVNMGRLGFMTELDVAEAETHLPAYLAGEATVEVRSMVKANVQPIDLSPARTVEFYGLNDVVVGRGAVARIIRVRTSVSGALVTVYRVDAIIVATATGSTGYALSAGGPVLYPTSTDLVVQPAAPHIGLRSGIVVPGDSVVEMVVETDISAMLSVDGYQDLPLQSGDVVNVTRSPYVARFLRMQGSGYFLNTLYHRLGLQQVPRRPSVS
jgi:NAD+ kinase